MAVRGTFVCAIVALAAWTTTAHALAQSALAGDPITIRRAPGPIVVDGDLSDEGWRDAARIDRWYETQPGDNVTPRVGNVGYLTYESRATAIASCAAPTCSPASSACRAAVTWSSRRT